LRSPRPISGHFRHVQWRAGPLFAVAASEVRLTSSCLLNCRNRARPRPGQEFRRSQRELQLEDVGGDPGIFRVADPSKASRKNGAVLFANTAWLVMPASMATARNLTSCAGLPVAATCGQPAGAGDYIQIFITGLGKATPGGDPNGKMLPTGSVAPANGSVLYQTVQKPAVTIGASTLRFYSPELLQALRGVPDQCSGAGWRHAGR